MGLMMFVVLTCLGCTLHMSEVDRLGETMFHRCLQPNTVPLDWPVFLLGNHLGCKWPFYHTS